jgi:prepilin-type processing-associated H-X9-DG protein
MHVEAYGPTSATVGQNWGGCIDYAAIKGIRTGAGSLAVSGLIDPVGNSEGAMPDSVMRRFTDIKDGTSNTILVAECAGRPQVWRAGQQIPMATLDPSMPRYPIEDAAGGDMPGGAWAEQQNAFFLDGSTPDGILKPGPCAVNCTNNYCGLPTRSYDDGETYSFHTGGANLVLVDGSVRFVRANIDIRIFARLVTRADGDLATADDL